MKKILFSVLFIFCFLMLFGCEMDFNVNINNNNNPIVANLTEEEIANLITFEDLSVEYDGYEHKLVYNSNLPDGYFINFIGAPGIAEGRYKFTLNVLKDGEILYTKEAYLTIYKPLEPIEDLYQVKVGDTLINMGHNSANLEEYVALINVSEGQTLKFLVNGEALNVTPDTDELNNLDQDLKVKVTASNVKVYLKENNVVFLDGYNIPIEEDFYMVFVGNSELGYPLEPNPANANELTATITAEAGQVLSFNFNYETLEVEAKTDEGNNVDRNLKVLTSGTFDIYLDLTTNKLWANGFKAPVEEEHVYKVFINYNEEGQEFTTEEGKDSLTITITVNEGDLLSFELDDNALTNLTLEEKEGQTNNLGEGFVVLSSGQNLVLILNSDGSLWLNGYVEPETPEEYDVVTPYIEG